MNDDQLNVPKSQFSAERLMRIRLHKRTLTDRNNFFLVAQSMIVLAVAAMIASGSVQLILLVGFAIFGLLMTAIWLFHNYRRRIHFNAVRKIALEACPEYEMIVQSRTERGFSSKFIMFYGIALLMLLFWLAMLVFLLVTNGMAA